MKEQVKLMRCSSYYGVKCHTWTIGILIYNFLWWCSPNLAMNQYVPDWNLEDDTTDFGGILPMANQKNPMGLASSMLSLSPSSPLKSYISTYRSVIPFVPILQARQWARRAAVARWACRHAWPAPPASLCHHCQAQTRTTATTGAVSWEIHQLDSRRCNCVMVSESSPWLAREGILLGVLLWDGRHRWTWPQ